MFCISLTAKNTEEALAKMAEAETLAPADLLEVRLDLMESFDLARIIRSAPKPVLVTYRTAAEGGEGRADPGIQADMLMTAIREGASFVDVERRLPPKWRRKILDARGDTKMILSFHDHQGTPPDEDLETILADSAASGSDVVKIVTTAKTWEDNLRVLGLIPRAQEQGQKIAAFCMGPMGRISRLFSHLMGGFVTFTALGRGQESAAGQIPLTEMKTLLEHFN